MRVLLTGANGFIGNFIAKVFSENTWEVLGIGIETINKNQYVSEYIKWDIGHEPIPEELIKGKIDCIVHAASLIDGRDLTISVTPTSNCPEMNTIDCR